MPLPPREVLLKRKRNEDEAPEILRKYIQQLEVNLTVIVDLRNEVTGLSADGYCYRRVHDIKRARKAGATDSTESSFFPKPLPSFVRPNGAPLIRTTKTGDEHRDPRGIGLGPTGNVSTAGSNLDVTAENKGTTQLANPLTDLSTFNVLRRYHLTRRASSPNARDGVKKNQSAIFVERRRPSSRTGRPVSRPVSRGKSEPQATETLSVENKAAPSVAKPQPAPLRNVTQESGKTLPWDATNGEMESAMQAYTLQEISRTLAETAKSDTPRKVSKFKPKAPLQRYHDRHPTEALKVPISDPLETEEETMGLDDEGEYIVDKFIRIPVEQLAMQGPIKNIGLLVLDSQPDIDQFYNDDSDDDSDIYDEEEDENAENHHSTDYPDEEVASDDEYDRNPYLFRNRNASDEEEFDEDDATFSDEEDLGMKAWSKTPPWMRTKNVEEEVE